MQNGERGVFCRERKEVNCDTISAKLLFNSWVLSHFYEYSEMSQIENRGLNHIDLLWDDLYVKCVALIG